MNQSMVCVCVCDWLAMAITVRVVDAQCAGGHDKTVSAEEVPRAGSRAVLTERQVE